MNFSQFLLILSVKNEIAPPMLQNDVSILPPVDMLQSHQLAVSEIRSPEPTRGFLQNCNFPTERTDTPSLIENNLTDEMLGMNRDILVELRKQMDILDVLEPQEIGDVASGAPPDYDIPVMPEIVFDDVDTSPVISSPQTVENHEQVTHNQTTAPNVENHFTFNVSTQPGQDPKHLHVLSQKWYEKRLTKVQRHFLLLDCLSEICFDCVGSCSKMRIPTSLDIPAFKNI